MTKDSRAGIHQLPLADILINKVHNDVATTHKAPRPGGSVVGTGVEEVAMVDVNTGRTIASNYPPTVEQRPEITDSNENLISEVEYNVSTVGEAQRPCLVANYYFQL